MRTGAMPFKVDTSLATSKRSRSVPKAVNNRGAHRRAGSRQIVKEEAIRMRAEEFSDPLFVLSDERQKTLELLGQQFNSQGGGPDDSGISGQGLGFLDQRQTLEDFLFLAAVMAVEELAPRAPGETFWSSAKVGHWTSRSAARAVVISFSSIWRATGK